MGGWGWGVIGYRNTGTGTGSRHGTARHGPAGLGVGRTTDGTRGYNMFLSLFIILVGLHIALYPSLCFIRMGSGFWVLSHMG